MKWISILPLFAGLGMSGCQTTSNPVEPPLTNQGSSADLRIQDINSSLQRHYQQVSQEVKQNCPDAATIEQLQKTLQRLREKVQRQQDMLKQQQSS
jgi:hypothetical protein